MARPRCAPFSYFRIALVSLCLSLCATGASAAQSRVVLVSVDGLRPDILTPEYAPRIATLIAAGTSAKNVLNDLPSVTMTNHATMLTGVVADRHHVVLDFELPGQLATPTIFDYIAADGLRGAFFATKTKMHYLARGSSLETTDIAGNSENIVARAIEQLTPDGPDLFFIHLRDPDSVGHADGWLSAPYFDAVRHIDELVGRLADAIAVDETHPTYLLLTADHGGAGTNHFTNIPENRYIPWVLVGPDIAAGRVLDEGVTTVDTCPTVLWLLGLNPPETLDGRPVEDVKDPAARSADASVVPPISLPCVILAAPLAVLGFLARRGSRNRLRAG